MVIHRSKVSRAQAGRHRRLRRGLAAAALGAVLAGSAGVPASHAATGVLAPAATTEVAATAGGSPSRGLDGLLGILIGSPQPTPSQQPTSSGRPTSSVEPTPTKPASPSQQPGQDDDDDEVAAPDRTAAPSPTQSDTAQPEAPQDGPPAGSEPSVPQPAAPAAGRNAAVDPAPGTPQPGTAGTPDPARPGTVPTSEPGLDAAVQSEPGPARTELPAGTNGRSGSTSLKATSAEETGPSPLLGWGIGLVGLSAIAGVVATRLRRT